jgi:predicted kinase
VELILLIGAQGAGKSSFYKERFFHTHMRINLDMLKTRHRERALLKSCFACKQAMVVDNTNPTKADRSKYIGAAHDAGFKVIGYFFQASIESLLARNQLRSGNARIAEAGVRSTYKALQRPTIAEGFAELFEVRLSDEFNYEIEDLSHDR